MTNRIFAILLFVLFPLKALAGLGDGMRFMSYEVPAEQRTSLVLPAGNHEWITFSDSLTVSFSLKIERDMGSFGYICRVALDDLLPIDLIMSPEDDNPSISATADHHNIARHTRRSVTGCAFSSARWTPRAMRLRTSHRWYWRTFRSGPTQGGASPGCSTTAVTSRRGMA